MLKIVKIENTNNVRKNKNAQHTQQASLIKQVINTKMQGMQKMDYTQNMPKYAKYAHMQKKQKMQKLQNIKNTKKIRDQKDLNKFRYKKKYQPSGEGGACSLPAKPHRLQNPKWPPGGPKMADGVWKGAYP